MSELSREKHDSLYNRKKASQYKEEKNMETNRILWKTIQNQFGNVSDFTNWSVGKEKTFHI